MKIKDFLKLVEIQTKIASIFPFAIGSIYTIYRYKSFHTINFFIMFISMICFDMATTTINNYTDYKKASKKHNYRENTNIIGVLNLKESKVCTVIAVLLSIAVTFGVILTIRTNIILLIIGGICFFVGIFYTFGPIPLSRMPLGEVFSGFFMGFVIVFISVYIHIYDLNIVNFYYENHMINLMFNLKDIVYIFLISIPLIMTISNLMLANNICDLEEDIINKRYTLPYYIGKITAVKLFNIMYYICYVDIILLVILKVFPPLMLLEILTFLKVNKNIKIFNEKQIKRETFVIAVKNLIMINIPLVVLLMISTIIY